MCISAALTVYTHIYNRYSGLSMCKKGTHTFNDFQIVASFLGLAINLDLTSSWCCYYLIGDEGSLERQCTR